MTSGGRTHESVTAAWLRAGGRRRAGMGAMTRVVVVMVVVATAVVRVLGVEAKERDPASFCYDGCSGHGTCVANVCQCEPGWYGESCGEWLGNAPLSVRGWGLATTPKDLAEILQSRKGNRIPALVAVSQASCAKCGAAEAEYAKFTAALPDVPFVRVDASRAAAGLVTQFLGVDGSSSLPVIVVAWDGPNRKRKAVYRGPHDAAALERFARTKLIPEKPFERGYPWPALAPPHETWVVVYGPSPRSSSGAQKPPRIDEDKLEVVAAAAEEMRARYDIRFFVVEDECPLTLVREVESGGAAGLTVFSASRFFRARVDETSAVTIPLDREPPAIAAGAQRPSLAQFVAFHATSLVSTLTAETFAAAEALSLPMLLVFVPTPDASFPRDKADLEPALERTAREFRGRISVLVGSSTRFEKEMRELRLYDPSKVSMAMNWMYGASSRFGDEEGETDVTAESFRKFCGEFLRGVRVPPPPASSSSSSATSAASPKGKSTPKTGTTNTKTGKDEEEEDLVPGIRERFGDAEPFVTRIKSRDDWVRVVLNETADAVVFVDDAKCPACRGLTPYFRKAAARLRALPEANRVVCAVLDKSRVHPLPESLAQVAAPAIVMVPAFAKSPPFRYFSAVAKVFPLMEWVRANAGVPFVWSEDLPQFDEEEKRLFKEQIRERELRREALAAGAGAASKQEL